MKWDGKSTLILEKRVHELQGKTSTNGGSSRQSGRADLTIDPIVMSSNLILQELSAATYDRE